MKVILTKSQMAITIRRLAEQIIELGTASEIALIGIQPRGVYLANRINEYLKNEYKIQLNFGILDITFYRDDIRQNIHLANTTNINFSIENKHVILIDDVLFTGRTIRAAMDALIDLGRPKMVSLSVLVNRRFSRELPIEATYIGKSIDTFPNEKVLVNWEENDGKDEVYIIEK